MNIEGAVRQTGGHYQDGLERWEIRIEKRQARNLPDDREDDRRPISLVIGDKHYKGFVKVTENNEYVWISPTLYTEREQRTTLAQALVEAGFQRNQRVQLAFDGERIMVIPSDLSVPTGRNERMSGGGDMPERFFGEVSGSPEGSTFASRQELSQSGVHKPVQAGISGSQSEGADSIVLSGGYEDDEDAGEEVVYTGHGGRDPISGRQASHQMLVRGNKALALSRKLGLPIRVIRGSAHGSPFSPPAGYRYDGLYRVEDHWKERGRSGFNVWRFRLVKISAQTWANSQDDGTMTAQTGDSARRTETLLSRIVRDTRQTRRIKELYDYRCQICGVRLEGNAGPYAEAAHIKPLGRPHNGPDILENLLCLCPNHHVLFDYGGIAIADDYSVMGGSTKLEVHQAHKISSAFLQYHRDHYGFDAL